MTGCITMLGRLGRDNAGNTLAIAAASLLPLMALIGGGVDISRSYMAKTELQSACDAGVLAGRKAMSKSGSYGTAEKAKANTMFSFNFNGDKLDVSDLAFETDDNDDGQVLGTATATVPTLVMKIFDKEDVDLSVNCMAELQIGNADVMFVLDNTTSMLYAPDDVNLSGTQYTVNDSRSRFYGLKEAVKDFHKTINQSVTDTRTRIRYGFVPYAMTVNVNGLLSSGQMPTSYIADTTSYQTRRAMFDKAIYVANSPGSPVNTVETLTNITTAQCDLYYTNDYPSSGNNPVNSGGPAPTATVVTTYSKNTNWVKTSGSGSSAKGTCKRNKSVVTTTYATWWEFTGWKYTADDVSTANFRNRTATRYATAVTTSTTVGSTARSKTRNASGYDMVELAALSQSGDVSGVTTTTSTGATWNGCIEERKSETPSGSYDFDPIPSTAYDLQFDTVPSSNDTRWKPMWHSMYIKPASWSNYYFKQSDGKFYQSSGLTGTSVNSVPSPSIPTAYCVAEMKLFDTQYATLSEDKTAIPAALTTYLATLGPGMYTYHDIGMIWGGRLTSPTGLFKDNVNLDADKINVSKHIIFMTDGMLDPEEDEYSAYGIENYDHRVAPAGSESTIYNRHMARFVAMCNEIKNQGTTIWVVAFGTTMTTQLQQCATGGRAYYSSNTTALRNTFKYIASQVADLRLGA